MINPIKKRIFIALLILLGTSFIWLPIVNAYLKTESTVPPVGSIEDEPFSNQSSKAVTMIEVTLNNGSGGKALSNGSGVIIELTATDFYVITNYHVVSIDGYYPETIKIMDYLGNYYYGDLMIDNQILDIASYSYDLALIKVVRTETLIEVALSSSKEITLGMLVHSIGYPGKERKFTSGNVLQMEEIESLPFETIVHNAEISQGSSGGALLDSTGYLLGLNKSVTTNVVDGTFVSAQAIPLVKIKEYLQLFNIAYGG
jgi:S1-C subfamily serine protease